MTEPESTTPRLRLQERAAGQLGYFSVGDARDCELSRSSLHRMVRAKLVVPAVPSVYRFAAVPETDDGLLMAALLSAGPHAAIARRTALRLLGLDPPPGQSAERHDGGGPKRRELIELVREDTTTLSIPGMLVHRTRSLPSCDVTVLEACAGDSSDDRHALTHRRLRGA